jgi:predicted dehydrogenase
MKVLVVGYGSIGKRHADILLELGLKVEVVSKQENVPLPHFKILEEAPLEIYSYFIVATETSRHFEVLTFLESNVSGKVILVEKPLFHSKSEFRTVNNQVFVAYNLRFHPALQKLKELIKDETILFIHSIAGQYLPDWRPERDYRSTYSAKKAEGGVLRDLSHEIDYLQWIAGDFDDILSFQEKLTDLEITSDDFVTAIAKTKQGALVNFTIDYCSKIPIRNLLVHTNSQTLQADLIKGELQQKIKAQKTVVMQFNTKRNDTYWAMHQAILRSDDKSVCTFAEGQQTMNIIERISSD